MKFFKRLLGFAIISTVMGLCAVAALYFYIRPDLPSVEVLKDVRLQTPMKIYTQDGKLISQFGVKRRIPLTLAEVPSALIDAIIATEDSRFFEHPGIDPIGIVRAAVNLMVTGEKGQGGSTLTMQLARGFFLTREKTYIRKFKEIFIAWHMERFLTKDEILTLYINKIELGHRAFGFGAAAQVYYGKGIEELDLAQIATLAGLPKAPSSLNPISNPKRAKARRKIVLLRMLSEQFISQDAYNIAAEQPVTASKHGVEIELDAPYLANMIYQEMVARYGKEQAETAGFRVYATAPQHLQKAATEAVVANLHDYDERHGFRGSLAQLWPVPEVDQPDSAQQLAEQAWSESAILEYLAVKPAFFPLLPAVVMRVEKNSITVLGKDGEYRVIGWDGLAWARPFISDNEQGPAPEQASDIIAEGALVWIRRATWPGATEQEWQLSQLPDVAGALVAIDPDNGAVRAVVGGYNFYQSQFNRAVQAKRQVGSNIKPFLYSAALDSGYTLASRINDAPINQWDRASGNAWRPKNSPLVYDGQIRLRIALGKSKNVVSVRLLRAVGIDPFRYHMREFGFDIDDLPRNESLALGTASLTPTALVAGFATFVNGGYAIEPHVIERIESQTGALLWQANPLTACSACVERAVLTGSSDASSDPPSLHGEQLASATVPPQAQRVISEQNAFLVREMLQTAVTGSGSSRYKTYWRGTGWRANTVLKRKDIGGKTGTTNDARDTWFSGFAPGLVATSWVGFDDMSRALGRTSRNQYLFKRTTETTGRSPNIMSNAMVGGEDGARVAQPAWIRFMSAALANVELESKRIPDGIAKVRIDRTTGQLTHRNDHTSRFEYFAAGTEPTSFVAEHAIVDPVGAETGEQTSIEDIF